MRNIAFTRLLKIRDRLREVNFRRQPQGDAYHVDTTDERGARTLFQMICTAEGTWKLSSASLPAWIVEAETIFAAAIVEEEAR